VSSSVEVKREEWRAEGKWDKPKPPLQEINSGRRRRRKELKSSHLWKENRFVRARDPNVNYPEVEAVLEKCPTPSYNFSFKKKGREK